MDETLKNIFDDVVGSGITISPIKTPAKKPKKTKKRKLKDDYTPLAIRRPRRY